MANQSNEETFFRQRRNLVITSTLYLIFLVGELDITQINFVLGKADVGNIQNLLLVFLGIGIYFLYRFYSYNDRGVVATFRGNVFRIAANKNKAYSINYAQINYFKYFPDHQKDGVRTISEINSNDSTTWQYVVINKSVKLGQIISENDIITVKIGVGRNIRIYMYSLILEMFHLEFFGDRIFPYLYFLVTGFWLAYHIYFLK